MTDESLPPEQPRADDDAAAADRQEPGARHRTLFRILGATGALVLLVVVTLLSALVISLNLWQCDVGGGCSDSPQNLVRALYFGGAAAGLVGTTIAVVTEEHHLAGGG